MNNQRGYIRIATVVIAAWVAYWGYVAYQAGQSAQRLEASGFDPFLVGRILREKSEAIEMMIGGAIIGAIGFAALYWIASGFKSGPGK